MAQLPLARQIAALVAPVHNVAYYTPEIRVFETLGVKGWWTAYLAYRSAPMGVVAPEVIAAAFYGFAVPMIRRAVPAVWEHISPQQALDVRLEAVDRAWRRIHCPTPHSPRFAGWRPMRWTSRMMKSISTTRTKFGAAMATCAGVLRTRSLCCALAMSPWPSAAP